MSQLKRLQELLIAVQLGVSETAIAKQRLEKVRKEPTAIAEQIMEAASTYRSAEAALHQAVEAAIQAHIDTVEAANA